MVRKATDLLSLFRQEVCRLILHWTVFGIGFVPVRKHGKLPGKTIRETYALEYGFDTLEVHADAISPGTRVVVVDDLLATGGTMLATENLMKKIGADMLGMGF